MSVIIWHVFTHNICSKISSYQPFGKYVVEPQIFYVKDQAIKAVSLFISGFLKFFSSTALKNPLLLVVPELCLGDVGFIVHFLKLLRVLSEEVRSNIHHRNCWPKTYQRLYLGFVSRPISLETLSTTLFFGK